MNTRIKYINRSKCAIRDLDFKNCLSKCKKIIRINDHESGLGEFDVMYCQICKLGYTNPFPTEETTGLLYDSKSTGDFDIINNSLFDRIKDFLSYRLIRRITSKISINNVIDYATGNGRFAHASLAAFRGANVTAVDYQPSPPPSLIKYANGKNSRIEYKQITDTEYRNKKYDLIILRHVLEHTHHPVELVKFLSNLLTTEGIIYIEVPNLKSGCAKIFGKYWKGYYVPRHIFHFTKESLNEILRLAGLHGDITDIEMPLMGNTFSIFTGFSKTNISVRFVGVLLHPLQILLGLLFGGSTALSARCHRKIF
jgi:2-polyprenyl-3-methyl-5-hydroxy-6-metoxy-1,4-benzoquinol methylase